MFHVEQNKNNKEEQQLFHVEQAIKNKKCLKNTMS